MDYINYTVRQGNTLFGIAQFFGTSAMDIARFNAIVYPYTIYPGQTLRIPTAQTTPPKFYFVRPGDTIVGIAARYALDANDLVAINNIEDPDKIYPGQRIQLYI